MIKASRFLSANEPDMTGGKKTPEPPAPEKRGEVEERKPPTSPTGRPGQVFVKIKKAANLPLVSGPVHRFVEIEYSGRCTLVTVTGDQVVYPSLPVCTGDPSLPLCVEQQVAAAPISTELTVTE